MRGKSSEWGIVVAVVVDKREISCCCYCCYCCSCKEKSFCFYTVNDVVVVVAVVETIFLVTLCQLKSTYCCCNIVIF
jgi:hypothetical protein